MTAYSYTDWNSKPADEQQNQPGISVDRFHIVNNPNRGVYWSPETAASALSVHIEQTLAGEDRLAARRMWNGLTLLHRQATESPRMVDRAMKPRQADAHNALGAYNGDLDSGQLEQLTSVFDDVVALQAEAQIVGVDPIAASRRMLQRAASRAVGYNMNDDRIEAEMRPLVQSDRGGEIIANMNQSVAQLQALLADRPLEDAMDNIPQIGVDTAYTDELRDDHRRLNDILDSVPLVLNPLDIEPERNFSVRMDTQQEATILETAVRWAGEQERMPEPREVHRVFASWRDNGVAESPYTSLESPALGVVVGVSPAALSNLVDLTSGLDPETPLIVLTSEANDYFREKLAETGRTVVDVTAEADSRGVHLSSRGQDLPANRVELMSLSSDEAANAVERSLAVNAFVGRSDGIGYLAAHDTGSKSSDQQVAALRSDWNEQNKDRREAYNAKEEARLREEYAKKVENNTLTQPEADKNLQKDLADLRKAPEVSAPKVANEMGDRSTMSALEAQAIHLAGTLRKLNLGVTADGVAMNAAKLVSLRKEAREVDAEVDPQRYYTAGNSRPHRGVNAVAFESATKYDAANRANAPARDIIGEAYDSIPKNTSILLVENKDNAANRWLEANVTDRRVLYAEASRTLSFSEIVGVGQEGETRKARESEMEFKIYDKPASQRSYGYKSYGNDGQEMEGHVGAAGNKRVCLDTPLEWDDPKVRGAVILVSGNASSTAINTSSQAVKIAQEAVMDRAHTALIMSDMTDKRASTDFHAAHMIRLAGEMGKKATVIDGRGTEMPLDQAREKTAHNAENYSQKRDRELGDKMIVNGQDRGRNSSVDVSAGSDLGQMALASLPGMNAVKAQRFAGSELTLKEIREDKSEDMRKTLQQLGMPATTRAVINDIEPWEKAMNRSMANQQAAESMNARLAIPGDEHHPMERASGPTKTAVFTIGEENYDFAKQPIAAFIGNSERFRQPGQTLTLNQAQKAGPGAERGTMVNPAEVIDRPALRENIREMTARGYGIGVTLEEGVSRAVIEEAAQVRDAKLVVVAPGNFMASSPELRAAMRPLFEQDRMTLVMPTSIAPHAAPEPKQGEERKPDTYIENRSTMQEMLATVAKVGVVIASSDKDQSLHIVRHMVDQDKPIAAVVPQDPSLAGTELYSGNTRMLRGKGKTTIESVALASAPSANAFAEITDDKDKTELVNGVRQGTAGQFQSSRIGRSDMLRSGRHHQTFGWESGAHPISGRESIARFTEKVEQGVGALGQYKEPTERELEKIRLAREEQARGRNESRVTAFVGQEFNSTSALHRTSIEADAERRIDLSNMPEDRFKHVSGEMQAARQAAAGGHSMN